jgi:hypothetical protein
LLISSKKGFFALKIQVFINNRVKIDKGIVMSR